MLTNKNGFTLIEFLVAIVILSVGLMALLQAMNYAIGHNTATLMREEGARLADEKISTEKSRGYDDIALGTTQENVQVNVFNAFKNYSVVKVTDTLSSAGNTKNVLVVVSWKYKGNRYTHAISTIVARSLQ